MSTPDAPRVPTAADDLSSVVNFLAREGGAEDLLGLVSTFNPQFAQQQIAQAEEISPAIARLQTQIQGEFGPQLAEAFQATQRAASPEFAGLQDALAAEATANVGQGLSAEERQLFSRDIRAAQAARGLADSPLGSVEESLALAELESQRRIQNLQLANQTSSQFRLPNVPGITPSAGAQPFQPVGVDQLFQSQGQRSALQANLDAQFAANNAAFTNELIGTGVGAAASLGGFGLAGGFGGLFGGAGNVGGGLASPSSFAPITAPPLRLGV